jgi:hypothetical protein
MSVEFAEEVRQRLYPTRARLPLWFRPVLSMTASQSLKVQGYDVRRVSDRFDLSGLMRSPLRPDFPTTLNPADHLPRIRQIAPIDGTEIVEWMHNAFAENIALTARVEEYNRLGSQLVGTTGDCAVPACIVEDVRFRIQPGSEIQSQGYAVVVTPRGTYNVPVGRSQTGIYTDLLTWASVPNVFSFQWVGVLLKWRELAETPINQTVGFYMDSACNTAPQFFLTTPPRPKVMARHVITLSSNKDQKVKLVYRNPNDYTKVISDFIVDVPQGTSDIIVTFVGFPVPPMVAEIQPERCVQTKLERYEVR